MDFRLGEALLVLPLPGWAIPSLDLCSLRNFAPLEMADPQFGSPPSMGGEKGGWRLPTARTPNNK